MKHDFEQTMRIIRASIAGVHAWQIIQCRQEPGRCGQAFHSDLNEQALKNLVRDHETLLASDSPDLVDPDVLSRLENAGFPESGDLPVNAATRYFAEKATDLPAQKALALAHGLQIVLEISRDGSTAQSIFRVLKSLDVLTGPEQAGLADDNEVFFKTGKILSGMCGPCPYNVEPGSWQMALRKVQNWSLKYSDDWPARHAAEIMAWPEVNACLDQIRAMPAQKILVIGHSYTLPVNWATLACFTDTAGSLVHRVNPGVVFHHLGHGGLTALQARDEFMPAALAMNPDQVLIVTIIRKDRDFAAMKDMAAGLAENGAVVTVPDRVHPDAASSFYPDSEQIAAIAKAAKIDILEAGAMMDAHPLRSDFVSLDGIHCRSSYHKFMAALWVRHLCGTRTGKLHP